jgi:hypothetical protein
VGSDGCLAILRKDLELSLKESLCEEMLPKEGKEKEIWWREERAIFGRKEMDKGEIK